MTSHATAPRGHAATNEPSRWVVRFASLVPSGARVLDLAAGRGRHARLFTSRGARVVAVDRDADALSVLESVPGIETRVLDLEAATWPLAGERFDAIVVTNYLHRPSLHALLAALADDCVLLYETVARGNEANGRPSNPDFLLEKDELLRVVEGRLSVVAFEQGVVALPPSGAAVVQRLAAVGSARPWPPALPPA
jgi:SAM-dependent methyltransferase